MEAGKAKPQEQTAAEPAAQESASPIETGLYAMNTPTGTPDGKVMIGQDIEIYPDRPCDAFSSFETRAFEAKDRRQTGDQFALLCGRASLPRVTSISAYRNLKSPHAMRLIDAGVIYWKPENRHRFALVFDKPPGKKLLQSHEAVPYKIPEDRVIQALITPVVTALAELRNVDMVHGGVNPENIFVAGAAGAESVILGECLSSAPSFRQHVLFETIERGMANPEGRGQGTQKDDLYALGMCVVMAVRGENFMAGKTDKEIISSKLENGSYGSIAGRERMPSGVAEFLRGVLNDDASQRWDIDDTLGWLEGRRLAPKQARMNIHAARPYIFKEHKYWELRGVAMAFSDDPTEAVVSIEKDQFDLWIKRNFEDKHLIQRLEKVWEREKGGSQDRLISSISMALDPKAPIRYRNVSAFPRGFGTALARAMAKGDDIQSFAEVLQQQFLNNWVSQSFDDIADASTLVSNLEKCRNFLTQKIPGYGMERVVYALNKDAACMSPLLKDHFVLGAGSLLLALEVLSGQSNKPDNVLDRHMVAFLSVREPKMIDPQLGHLISHDRSFQLVGIVRTLAAIQKKFAIQKLPGLADWIVSMIGPAVNRFNDRDLRAEISKRMAKIAETGSLIAIQDLVDDLKMVQDDMARFALARKEFAVLVREKENIDAHLKKKKNFGYATGRQVAMLVSSCMGVAGILGYIVYYFAAGL